MLIPISSDNEELTVKMDVNEDGGVLYDENTIQSFLEITNHSDKLVLLRTI